MVNGRSRKELSDLIPFSGLRKSSEKYHDSVLLRDVRLLDKGEISFSRYCFDSLIDTSYFMLIAKWNFLPEIYIAYQLIN